MATNIRTIGWFSLAMVVVLLGGCKSKQNPSGNPHPTSQAVSPASKDGVVFDDLFDKVQNGSAYDKAEVDVSRYTSIVLPSGSTVETLSSGKMLTIFMKKTLSLYAHDDEPLSIVTVRKNMGCAAKEEGGTLQIGTFGEWDSHIEGGTEMTLIFKVPPGLKVEKKDSLSGQGSVAREWEGEYISKPPEVKEGYGYNPATQATGWKRIRSVPDLAMTARDARASK